MIKNSIENSKTNAGFDHPTEEGNLYYINNSYHQRFIIF